MKTPFQCAIGTIVLVAIVVAGCNKYEPVHKPNNQDPLSSRVGKTFTYADTVVDSAMVIIEENLNHDFCNPGDGFGSIVIDTGAYTFNVSGMDIGGADALTDEEQEMILDSSKDWVERYPTRVDTSGMGDHILVLVDVYDYVPSFEGLNPSITFKQMLLIGPQNAPAFDCEDWNDFDKDWYAVYDLGWCPGQGTGPGQGTFGSQMTKKINSYINSPECFPSCEGGHYYSNIHQQSFQALDFDNPDDNVLDGDRDYLLWSNKHDPFYDFCVYESDEEWYTPNAISIATSENWYPSTKIPYVYYVYDAQLTIHQWGAQVMWVWYGELECK